MAQTSLIIGDTNWAVKEDSLLGYNVIQNNYLPIPIDCVRATTATRVNEQGLIEIVPRNLLQYSQEFENAYWQKDAGVTVDSNVANSPNGSLTADRINFSTSGIALYRVIDFTTTAKLSVYLKGEGANIGKQIYLEIAGVGSVSVTLTAEWNRFVIDANNANAVAIKRLSGGQADSVLAWGIQLEQGSVATEYFPTTNRLDIPRIDYSTGTASLLVEPQRTNLFINSNDIIGVSGGTVNSNVFTSPDGTQNSDQFIVSTDNTYHAGVRDIVASASTTFNVSLFVKAGTGRYFLFRAMTNSYVTRFGITVDLQTGTILQTDSVGSPTATSSKIENYGNGWYRLSLTMASIGTQYGSIWSASNVANPTLDAYLDYTYAGNGTDSYYIWGFQMEQGSYATSYIPTIASSVTRNADIISRTGISGLIGQTEGTVFVDITLPNTSANDIFTFNNSGVNDVFLASNGGNLLGRIYYNGNPIFFAQYPITSLGGRFKMLITYKSGNSSFYVNGTLLSNSTTSFAFTNTLSDVNLTNNFYAGANKRDYNSVQLYKTALTNAECIALTTI